MSLSSLNEFVRGLVRPLTTIMVLGAQIAFFGAGVHSGDLTVAKELLPLTGIVITFWFVDRGLAKAHNGNGHTPPTG